MTNPGEQLCPGCFELVGQQRRCNRCGYDQDADRSVVFLPHLHLLGAHFLVGRVLGRPGGFGITYLGWDINLERKVAIKEYLPKRLATRAENGVDVALREEAERKDFEFGRKEFLAEARTVARFDHPNVVRVRNFFRANGTAYMVMDYYSGISLADHIVENQTRIPVDTAVSIIRPILGGLQLIHDHGYLHRDVKPANIYLASVGRPILLDFGAARLATSKHSDDSSIVLTDGYAPLEQYQRGGKQGPWTDVYGAAATLYRLLSGENPPVAMDRIGAEELSGLQDLPDLNPQLLEALRRAMAVHVNDRTSSASRFATELEAALDGASSRRLLEPAPVEPPKPETAREQVAAQLQSISRRQSRWPWPQGLLTLSIALLVWQLLPAIDHQPALALSDTTPDSSWSARQATRPQPADAAAARLPPQRTVPAGLVRQQERRVTIPAFAISEAPVSVAAFRRFVEQTEYRNSRWAAHPCRNPAGSNIANWQAPGRAQSEEDAVVCVDWQDARAYADWLSAASHRHFRLPTLAEWYRHLAEGKEHTGAAERVWSCSGTQDPVASLRCLDHAGPDTAVHLLNRLGQSGVVSAAARASDLGFYLVEELD